MERSSECCLDSLHRQIPKGSFIIPDLVKTTHSPVSLFILEPLHMGQSQPTLLCLTSTLVFDPVAQNNLRREKELESLSMSKTLNNSIS